MCHEGQSQATVVVVLICTKQFASYVLHVVVSMLHTPKFLLSKLKGCRVVTVCICNRMRLSRIKD